ncbi:MAPEG family protein [Limnohabitans sp. Rim11]|uniref:MAPEG family protein n=1 Tax=Limnohabitans sp. Rim11 TaxID=1100719 RepID=UPI000AA840E2|nr:MAPEG family protein [Limnohabitans sp. Rim11]
MDLPIASLLFAGAMPWICAGIAKGGQKNYDNHNPREWLAKQTGYRARANAAQANCFEAFPMYAVGVLLAMLSDIEADQLEMWAGLFIAARVAYVACYVMDKDKLRSLAWLVGVVSTVALYVLSASQ